MTYLGILRRHYVQNAHACQRGEARERLRMAAPELLKAAFYLGVGIAVLTVAPLGTLGGRHLFKKLALRGGKHPSQALSFAVASIGR